MCEYWISKQELIFSSYAVTCQLVVKPFIRYHSHLTSYIVGTSISHCECIQIVLQQKGHCGCWIVSCPWVLSCSSASCETDIWLVSQPALMSEKAHSINKIIFINYLYYWFLCTLFHSIYPLSRQQYFAVVFRLSSGCEMYFEFISQPALMSVGFQKFSHRTFKLGMFLF